MTVVVAGGTAEDDESWPPSHHPVDTEQDLPEAPGL
jgi:hypothetical protein